MHDVFVCRMLVDHFVFRVVTSTGSTVESPTRSSLSRVTSLFMGSIKQRNRTDCKRQKSRQRKKTGGSVACLSGLALATDPAALCW